MEEVRRLPVDMEKNKLEKKNIFPTRLERIMASPSKETFGAIEIHSSHPSWAARSGLGCYQSLWSIWEGLYLGIAPPNLGRFLKGCFDWDR